MVHTYRASCILRVGQDRIDRVRKHLAIQRQTLRLKKATNQLCLPTRKDMGHLFAIDRTVNVLGICCPCQGTEICIIVATVPNLVRLMKTHATRPSKRS